MPDSSTHIISAGLLSSYVGARMLGVDTDYLVIGLIGALLASASEDPVPIAQCEPTPRLFERSKKLMIAATKLFASSFVAAITVMLLVHWKNDLAVVGIPLAGFGGFFGQTAIKVVRDSIPKIWQSLLSKFGFGDKNA